MNDLEKEIFQRKVEYLIKVILAINAVLACETKKPKEENDDVLTDSDFRVLKVRLVWADKLRARYLTEAEKHDLLKEDCITRLHDLQIAV